MIKRLFFFAVLLVPTSSFAARLISGGSSSSSGGSGSSGYIDVQDEGSNLVKRSTINFIGSAITCVDNSGTTVTDCTVASSGGATVSVPPASVLFSTGGTTINGDSGLQYDNSVSSLTANGKVGITNTLLLDIPSVSAGIGANRASFSFNPRSSTPLAILKSYNSSASSGGLLMLDSNGNDIAEINIAPQLNGSFKVQLASDSVVDLTTRYIIDSVGGKQRFVGTDGSQVMVQFDPVGNSSFTIPVVLTTLPSVSSLATDSTGKIIAGSGGSSTASGPGGSVQISSNAALSSVAGFVLSTGAQNTLYTPGPIVSSGTASGMSTISKGLTINASSFATADASFIAKQSGGAYALNYNPVTNIFTSSVNVIIGTATYNPFSDNPLSMVGNTNSFLQQNIQNNSSGNNASGDLVITNDLGNNTSGYVNLGINSSGNNQSSFSIATSSDSYLYASNRSFAIGTMDPGSDATLRFFTGGTTLQNQRVYITNTGNFEVVGSSFGVNGSTMNWPSSNASGALTNNGSGSLSWVSSGGGGSSIYAATSTAIFPFGSSFSTITVTNNVQIGTTSTLAGVGNLVTGSSATFTSQINIVASSSPWVTGGTSSIRGSNSAGIVTLSGALAQTLTMQFGAGGFTTTPSCVFNWSGTYVAPPRISAISSTSVTFSTQIGDMLTGSLYYICVGISQ